MIERDWLVDWFSRRNADVDVNMSENVLYSGLIDSLGFVELIESIEKKFNVSFLEDDFINQEGFTINALAKLIAHKREQIADV